MLFEFRVPKVINNWSIYTVRLNSAEKTDQQEYESSRKIISGNRKRNCLLVSPSTRHYMGIELVHAYQADHRLTDHKIVLYKLA